MVPDPIYNIAERNFEEKMSSRMSLYCLTRHQKMVLAIYVVVVHVYMEYKCRNKIMDDMYRFRNYNIRTIIYIVFNIHCEDISEEFW